MCWIGNLDLKHAEKDIPIFKIMLLDHNEKNSVCSYYCLASYKIGELKESSIIPDKKNWSTQLTKVSIALHSYNPLKINAGNRHNGIKHNALILTIYCDLILDSYPAYCRIVKGYIPKDSLYCENENGEFISDKLILTEICGTEFLKE